MMVSSNIDIWGIEKKSKILLQKKLGTSLCRTSENIKKSFQRKEQLEVLCKKGVTKNFAKFTRNTLCRSLFSNRVVGLRTATLFKKRLRNKRFLVSFQKFERTPFYRRTPGDCFCNMYIRSLIFSVCQAALMLVIKATQPFLTPSRVNELFLNYLAGSEGKLR